MDRIAKMMVDISRSEARKKEIKTGIVLGSSIIVGGRAFLMDCAINAPIRDGSVVKVLISGYKAVVVGL